MGQVGADLEDKGRLYPARKPKPNMSLAERNPEIAKEWDNELNEFSSSEVTYGSHYLAHWVCSECHHSWKATVNNRTNINTGNKGRCPKCSSKLGKESYRKTAVEKRGSLAKKFPELCKELSKNNTIDPTTISSYSHTKLLWHCADCGTEWLAPPKQRIFGKTGCPRCKKSKGENFICEIFETLKIPFEQQKRFEDCRNIRTLPFDFSLNDGYVLVEYDGEAHFAPWYRNKKFLKKLSKTKKNDTIKNEWAKKTNRLLYRFSYTMSRSAIRQEIIGILEKHNLLLSMAV